MYEWFYSLEDLYAEEKSVDEVDNGLDASALFAYLAKGRYNREQVDRVREDLMEYCGLDTMAMVRLVEGVRGVAE